MMKRILILLASFVVMFFLTALASAFFTMAFGPGRNCYIAVSAAQGVLAFIIPAWITARITSQNPIAYLGLDSPLCFRGILCVVMLFILAMPFLNAVVNWNAALTLPDALSSLEEWMRTSESGAAEITDIILNDSSVWGLISGLLVVGCLTGIAEEAFFRAGLQKCFTSSGMNHHSAIWIAAFIFSAIHFQFFGFVPRLLLGAIFGYIYWYSNSLWLSAFAHALNNSVVVVSAWLLARGEISETLEDYITNSPHAGTIELISAVLTALFFAFFFKRLISKLKNKPNETDTKSFVK
ncbi:MAG: CPBP family intramembrane metalloprotease [Candidatus Amulumruptor caecigallinarius]|nr:CPBP family intramembrane metalloprotease [Candidatus Amulumruptor caecigallinarius]